MKTTFRNTDNSVIVEFEYINTIIETQYLPSGEEVKTELMAIDAAKRQAQLTSDGFIVTES